MNLPLFQQLKRTVAKVKPAICLMPVTGLFLPLLAFPVVAKAEGQRATGLSGRFSDSLTALRFPGSYPYGPHPGTY
jgi:hypothetical protein